MPRKPKKTLPWLISNLDKRLMDNSKGFVGLVWENRRNGLFWLPWPRFNDIHVTCPEAEVFLGYAKLHKQYKDKDEYSTWKLRLRTTLNKESCLREDRKRSQKRRKLFEVTDLSWIKELPIMEGSSPNNPQGDISFLSADNDISLFDDPYEAPESSPLSSTSSDSYHSLGEEVDYVINDVFLNTDINNEVPSLITEMEKILSYEEGNDNILEIP